MRAPSKAASSTLQAWLSGRDAKERRTPEGLRQAISHFERAIALDTMYAGAHADLSQAMTLALVYHYRMPASPFELAARALKEADRAVALRPDLADGYLALGLLGVSTGAPMAFCKSAYDRAERLMPVNRDARQWQIGVLGRQERFEEAVQRSEEEVRLEPRSAGKRYALAMYALAAGQYDKAIQSAAESRAILPGVAAVSQVELWARRLLKGPDLAECEAIPPGPYLGARALCLEAIGRAAEGKATRDALERTLTGKFGADSTFDRALKYGELAVYAAQREDRDATRRWLASAFADSPAGVDYRMMRTPMFEPWAVQYADSLQQKRWARVVTAARPAK